MGATRVRSFSYPVEVVEHGQTRFSSLSIVGLGFSETSGLGPVVELAVGIGGRQSRLVGRPKIFNFLRLEHFA